MSVKAYSKYRLAVVCEVNISSVSLIARAGWHSTIVIHPRSVHNKYITYHFHGNVAEMLLHLCGDNKPTENHIFTLFYVVRT